MPVQCVESFRGEGGMVESDWRVYKYYDCRGRGTRENFQHIEHYEQIQICSPSF